MQVLPVSVPEGCNTTRCHHRSEIFGWILFSFVSQHQGSSRCTIWSLWAPQKQRDDVYTSVSSIRAICRLKCPSGEQGRVTGSLGTNTWRTPSRRADEDRKKKESRIRNKDHKKHRNTQQNTPFPFFFFFYPF